MTSEQKNRAPTTVDEYIAACPPERQEMLRAVRQTVRENAPDATEKISWGMPTWWQRENLIHFALGKHHLGVYPGAEAMVVFAPKFAGLKTSKGAVQFPLKDPIPHALIAEITRWRVAQQE